MVGAREYDQDEPGAQALRAFRDFQDVRPDRSQKGPVLLQGLFEHEGLGYGQAVVEPAVQVLEEGGGAGFHEPEKQGNPIVNAEDASALDHVRPHDVVVEIGHVDAEDDEVSVDLKINTEYTDEQIKSLIKLEKAIEERDKAEDKMQEIYEMRRDLNRKIRAACDKIVDHLVSQCDEKELKKIVDDIIDS